MTNDRQRAANRANAQKSTGPRTPEGLARSRRNATKHGLGTPPARDPVWQDRIHNLHVLLAGLTPTGQVAGAALEAAEATAALERVDLAKQRAWSDVTDSLGGGDGDQMVRHSDALRELRRLERYERRALSRWLNALAHVAKSAAVEPESLHPWQRSHLRFHQDASSSSGMARPSHKEDDKAADFDHASSGAMAQDGNQREWTCHTADASQQPERAGRTKYQ